MEVMSILCISHTDICLSLVGLFLLLLLEINFRIALVRFLITPNLHVTRGDEKNSLGSVKRRQQVNGELSMISYLHT